MKLAIKSVLLIIAFCSFYGCKQKSDPLGNATREDKNGWIYVHLEGSPHDVGYQHGYLVAKEIDTLIKVFQFYLPHTTKRDWAWYRSAAGRFIWNKIDTEYQQELIGMAEGLRSYPSRLACIEVGAQSPNMEEPTSALATV